MWDNNTGGESFHSYNVYVFYSPITTITSMTIDLNRSHLLEEKKNRKTTKNTVSVWTWIENGIWMIVLLSDDPYYCGLRARVPNFVAKSKTRDSVSSKRFSISQHQGPPPVALMHQHHPMHQHAMWHTRSFESGIGKRSVSFWTDLNIYFEKCLDSDAIESPYNQIYGRLPIPTRAYIPTQPRTMYIGEWD